MVEAREEALVVLPVAAEDALKVSTAHCTDWTGLTAHHQLFIPENWPFSRKVEFSSFPHFYFYLYLKQIKTQAGIGFRREKCNYQD